MISNYWCFKFVSVILEINKDDNLDVSYTAEYAGENVELSSVSLKWIDKVCTQ